MRRMQSHTYAYRVLVSRKLYFMIRVSCTFRWNNRTVEKEETRKVCECNPNGPEFMSYEMFQ